MPGPAATVRPLTTASEIDAFFRLATQTFIPSEDPEREATGWGGFVTNAPDFQPEQMRGAFRGDTLVGGCIVYERELRLGAARLRTGCVGAVVTHPDQRRQGIASAVMQDVTARALARRQALLLLGGIPDFYHRFGYADVLETTEHAIERKAIIAYPRGPYRTRAATPADAPTMLALYERHYGPYPGSFERTLAQQEHLLRFRLQHNPPMLAIDPEGRPHGYLIHPWSAEETYTTEVAADDWPALLALLQHAAHHRPSPPDRADEVLWPLPPDSPMFYRLADRLPVRSQTHSHPNEGWMARPGHLPEMFRAMLPEWQVRWQRHAPPWTGTLGLAVGDETCVLELGPDSICLCEHPVGLANAVTLSPKVFTQLLFGYRPAPWAAEQPWQQVPEVLLSSLDALFPTAQAWIAGSDAF